MDKRSNSTFKNPSEEYQLETHLILCNKRSQPMATPIIQKVINFQLGSYCVLTVIRYCTFYCHGN